MLNIKYLRIGSNTDNIVKKNLWHYSRIVASLCLILKMDIWIKAAQLFLSLAICYTAVRAFHSCQIIQTRIEKFYLFFNPGSLYLGTKM